MSATYEFEQTFDPVRKLQYVNTDPSVMHCHHYATLITHMALDLDEIGAPRLLEEAMEEAIYLVLKKQLLLQNITSRDARVAAVEEHFRLTGLGSLELTVLSEGEGAARLSHSHIDEGWIKKWGTADGPVNRMGAGYLAAAFAVIHDARLRTYVAEETKSMASGETHSEFVIRRRGNGYGD